MSSLAGLLELSRGALLADQSALSATANNVANQNTAGYTTQVVSFSSNDTVSLGFGTASTGAPEAITASARDRVLEYRIQQQTQQQSGTNSQAAVLAQIESVFSITGSPATAGSTALGTSLDGFFSSLSSLASNPSDGATQQAAVSAASTVASAFQAAAAGLAGISVNVNASLASSVDGVNALTAKIATLNGEISTNSPNKDAGPLEDQRQAAIAQLSQLIRLDQTKTENNGITLTTSGGSALVSGQISYRFAASQVGNATRIYDSQGADITLTTSGGTVGGNLTAQNINLPTFSAALDALAYRLGTNVNSQNSLGLTPQAGVGGPVFSLPTSSTGAAAKLAITAGAIFATAGAPEGSTGNTNANRLAGISTAVDLTNLTITGQLATFLSGVGSQSSAQAGQAAAEQTSLTQLRTQRDTLSGVNLDTEASNLTTFQRSYQAAAQVLAIVNRLMAAAINLGTETTVS